MRRLSVFLLAAALLFQGLATSAEAATTVDQKVKGAVSVPAPSADVARRVWNATDGAVNGVAGYVFKVSSVTLGGDFQLSQKSALVSGVMRVTFYDQIVAGHVCATYKNSIGHPCGTHAIVWMTRGARVQFVYTATRKGGVVPTWQPPPGSTPSGTYLYLASDPGDYIGGGRTYLYTLADSVITVGQGGRQLTFDIVGDERWDGTFAAPQSQARPTAGYYSNLKRYPFHDPAVGGFSFTGEGRGCNTSNSWVVIDSITYDNGGAIQDVTLRFQQNCEETGPPLRGKLHWNRFDVAPPPPDPGPTPTWQPPSGATPATGTYVYLESQPGDYIGGGLTYVYTLADSLIPLSRSGGVVNVNVQGDENWYGNFAMPNRLSRPEPGYYPGLERYPFNNPVKGGLDWSGEGRGCNKLSGWIVVDSVSYDSGGDMQELTLRFQQKCEEVMPPLRGKIHWIANDVPPPPPDPGPAPTWQPPAGATPSSGTYLYLDSATGDWVGQGKTYLYTLSDAQIGVTQDGVHIGLSVNGDEFWNGDFAVPNRFSRPEAGYYPDLERYPFNNPVKGGLAFYGEGRGCNRVAGWIVIDSVSYDSGGAMQDLTLRFQQNCEETMPPLRGKLHWTADATPPPPPDPGPAPDWQPPPGSTPATGSYLYLASDPGDYIGAGQTYLYTTSAMTVTQNSGLIEVRINNGTDNWTGDFKVPDSFSRAEAGYYPGLERYPFHNPTKGGLSFYGNGRGCNTLTGWFSIDDIHYTNMGALQDVTLRFEQHCEGGTPALRGKLYWTVL